MKKSTILLAISVICCFITISNVKAEVTTCRFDSSTNRSIIFYYDSNSKKVTYDNEITSYKGIDNVMVNFSQSDFVNSNGSPNCPDSIYFYITSGIVHIYTHSVSTLGSNQGLLRLSYSNTDINFCSKTATIWQFIGNVFLILKVVLPLVIIILATIDFGKAVALGNDDKQIKEKAMKLIKRLIAGIAIFFVPTLIKIAFNLVTQFSDDMKNDLGNCINCLTDPNNSCDTSYQGNLFK